MARHTNWVTVLSVTLADLLFKLYNHKFRPKGKHSPSQGGRYMRPGWLYYVGGISSKFYAFLFPDTVEL